MIDVVGIDVGFAVKVIGWVVFIFAYTYICYTLGRHKSSAIMRQHHDKKR